MAEMGQEVTLNYVGKLEDGTVFADSSREGAEPLTFIVGTSEVLPAFDEAVRDMVKGDKKTIELEPYEAYGEYNPDLLQTEPISEVAGGEELAKCVGQVVYMQDSGEMYPARVISAENGNISVDFNHPLAGKHVSFELEMIDLLDRPSYSHGAPIEQPPEPAAPGEVA